MENRHVNDYSFGPDYVSRADYNSCPYRVHCADYSNRQGNGDADSQPVRHGYPVTVTSAHDVTVTITATTTETIVTTLTTSYPVVSHETVTQPASTMTQPASTVTQPASTSKITVCPAPTGLHAPLAPGSSLTFGCSPGSVCSPPMPRGCDMWPGPPSDDFVCPASECIPSPPFIQTHWPDNETSYYYPRSNGYFSLDPTEFGLTYDVFVDHGRDHHHHHHHAGQKRAQRGRSLMKRAPAPPSRCFDECNNAYLIAEAGGKTDELCRARSSFRLGFELCTACIRTHASMSSSRTMNNDDDGDDYIGSVFAQFLDFCNGRRSEPTSTVSAQQPSRSPPGAPDQALSSQPLLTTTQVGASSGGFEPSPSSTTTAQATRSATTTERPKTSSNVDSGAEDDKTTTSITGAVSAAKTSQSSISSSSSSSSSPEAGAVSSTAHHGGAAGEDESTTPVVKSEYTSRDPPFTSSATLTPKGTGTPLVLVNGVTGRCGLAGAAPALMVAMIVLMI
ncbi:glycoprotein X [Beauveria brongniartii RCEF 3172]|uniref:Glycoprotein X n=1 Tax=Beauveria brongniartii RCEF 3172 TaxID=1081107 RepID=A0A167DIG2_9HYPO|nr:glycoprotein X [Beauveria brongniartii RCEF 3172]